jgi:hypothetical protein
MSERKSEERKRAEFLEAAEAMYERMVRWREAHPEASFDEIADEVGVERRMLMGQLLAGLATQPASEVEALEVICPECAGESEGKGSQRRTVNHREGDVTLNRGYRYCARCGSGFFPPGPDAEAGEA